MIGELVNLLELFRIICCSRLVKKYDMRPNYPKLLEHPFIVAHTPHQNVTFAKFIAEIFPPEVEEEIMDQS